MKEHLKLVQTPKGNTEDYLAYCISEYHRDVELQRYMDGVAVGIGLRDANPTLTREELLSNNNAFMVAAGSYWNPPTEKPQLQVVES